MWFWENAEKEQFLQKQHVGFSFNKITFQLLFRENNKFFYFQPNYPWLRKMSPKYMYSIQMHLQICLPCNVQAILWSQTQSNNWLWLHSAYTAIRVSNFLHCGVVLSANPQNRSTYVSGSHDHTIKLWDANTHRCVKTMQGHTDGVWSLNYMMDGKRLISGSVDGTARLWDTQSG